MVKSYQTARRRGPVRKRAVKLKVVVGPVDQRRRKRMRAGREKGAGKSGGGGG